jgi:hypothetical protein
MIENQGDCIQSLNLLGFQMVDDQIIGDRKKVKCRKIWNNLPSRFCLPNTPKGRTGYMVNLTHFHDRCAPGIFKGTVAQFEFGLKWYD